MHPLDSFPSPPRTLGGRYELVERIGRGGMGEVWEARHVDLGTSVAIKLLSARRAKTDKDLDKFLQEARLTATVGSKYAVQVFDFGLSDDSRPYLVMELLRGKTVSQLIGERGRLSKETTGTILRQAARALAKAHEQGIVHRDFKPENIMLVRDEDGEDLVKVLDFGIARLVGRLDDAPKEGTLDETAIRTTRPAGTPAYMAPEQIVAQSGIDARCDIWALGVVAYECLTGMMPFTGDTVESALRAVLQRQYTPAHEVEPAVDPCFDSWFQLACEVDPDLRFADVGTAITALDVVLELSEDHSLGGLADGAGAGAPKRVTPPAMPTVADIPSPPPAISRVGVGALAAAALIGTALGAAALYGGGENALSAPSAPAMERTVDDQTATPIESASSLSTPRVTRIGKDSPADLPPPETKALESLPSPTRGSSNPPASRAKPLAHRHLDRVEADTNESDEGPPKSDVGAAIEETEPSPIDAGEKKAMAEAAPAAPHQASSPFALPELGL